MLQSHQCDSLLFSPSTHYSHKLEAGGIMLVGQYQRPYIPIGHARQFYLTAYLSTRKSISKQPDGISNE